MVRKTTIKYLLVREIIKYVLYGSFTVFIISLFQSRSEMIANQFDLNDETQLFYKKNFTHFSNLENICPLYPKELGNL